MLQLQLWGKCQPINKVFSLEDSRESVLRTVKIGSSFTVKCHKVV